MNDAEPASTLGAHLQVKFRRGVQITALTSFPLVVLFPQIAARSLA